MTTTSTCETCQYWDTGVCGLVDLVEVDMRNQSRDAFEVNVRVVDDHGLRVELRTGPDFGCNRHQPRQTEYSTTMPE